jgi:hypothetical protein
MRYADDTTPAIRLAEAPPSLRAKIPASLHVDMRTESAETDACYAK